LLDQEVGKTQFCLDFTTKACAKYNVPLLHFDNGEMSEEELISRQCAALSGVPLYLIESGNWRKAGEPIVQKVRSVWVESKKTKTILLQCRWNECRCSN